VAPRRKRLPTPPLLTLPLLRPTLLPLMPARLLLTRALLLRTLLLRTLLLRTLLLSRRRNRLLRRSKRLLYGLNGRADGAETPRLPPAVVFPGS
jgi:hypothetical protein